MPCVHQTMKTRPASSHVYGRGLDLSRGEALQQKHQQPATQSDPHTRDTPLPKPVARSIVWTQMQAEAQSVRQSDQGTGNRTLHNHVASGGTRMALRALEPPFPSGSFTEKSSQEATEHSKLKQEPETPIAQEQGDSKTGQRADQYTGDADRQPGIAQLLSCREPVGLQVLQIENRLVVLPHLLGLPV